MAVGKVTLQRMFWQVAKKGGSFSEAVINMTRGMPVRTEEPITKTLIPETPTAETSVPDEYKDLHKQIDIMDLSKDTDLSVEQQTMVQEFLKKNVKIFAPRPLQPYRTPKAKHGIDTGTARPIHTRPF